VQLAEDSFFAVESVPNIDELAFFKLFGIFWGIGNNLKVLLT